MPPPQGLCIAFSLQERFPKGLALSLARTVPYSHVFGVAEPKHIRARSPCPHLPSSTAPGCHSSLASPLPTLPLSSPRGRGGPGAWGCFAWSRWVALRPRNRRGH